MIAGVVAALAALLALCTWTLGWWAVVVVGAIAGAVWPRPAAIALAAVLGWSALLAVDAIAGRLGTLAAVLGGIFPISGPLLIAVTLLFAALGAWSAATIGAEAARRLRRAP